MPATDANISQLLAEFRRADPAALGRLLGAYRHYLWTLAHTQIGPQLRDKVDASDVAQETLLKAFQRFAEFRGQTEAELTAWLRTILARTLTDLLRRYLADGRCVARERALEQSLEDSSRLLSRMLAASTTSPSQAAAGREMAVALADALAELNEDYRQVILLRNFDNADWAAIAARMGRSPGAVRMLWTRALQELRHLLEVRP